MKTKYSISEKYLGFCFSDKTTPAIENYVPVIYGLQNKIQDTFLKIYRMNNQFSILKIKNVQFLSANPIELIEDKGFLSDLQLF